MTGPLRLTLSQAAARTRQPVLDVEAALKSGDLRSLARRDVDAWRREVIARSAPRTDQ